MLHLPVSLIFRKYDILHRKSSFFQQFDNLFFLREFYFLHGSFSKIYSDDKNLKLLLLPSPKYNTGFSKLLSK